MSRTVVLVRQRPVVTETDRPMSQLQTGSDDISIELSRQKGFNLPHCNVETHTSNCNLKQAVIEDVITIIWQYQFSSHNPFYASITQLYNCKV